LRGRANDLFGWLAKGDLKANIGARFAVSQVAEAFTALEGRATTGKVLLTH
jgi:NADPH2:quinone reductase